MIDSLTLGTDKVRYFIQLLLVSFLDEHDYHNHDVDVTDYIHYNDADADIITKMTTTMTADGNFAVAYL